MEQNRLSEITTCWSEVLRTHKPDGSEVSDAQRALLQRYGGAIHRYLLAVLRDPDAADELSQEFALRLVRGAFKAADPERGRFRDLVKTAVYHLIVDYHRRNQKMPQALPNSSMLAAADTDGQSDQEFLQSWRDELLDRAWEALAESDGQRGRLFHTVLRLKTDNLTASTAELAEKLRHAVGKPCTVANFRQTLHRARERFADLLLDEVARSLQTRDPDRIEQELLDLGLFVYCRPAWDRRARTGKPR